MNNRLRRREFCPLHKSYYCSCHQVDPAQKLVGRSLELVDQQANTQAVENQRFLRAQKRKPAVQRIDDPHHPRGYREVCSAPELRRRKNLLILKAEPHPLCHLCGEGFSNYSEIELEHIEPKGMGGAWHDDHMDNLALAHRSCNREKGSRHIA